MLTNVGLDAYAAKLAIEAKAGRKKHKTDMMQSLDKLVKTIGVLIIPIGCLLYTSTRKDLYKKQKLSGTVVKGKKIGRNDPCPCGSGKKYKQCCGKNA